MKTNRFGQLKGCSKWVLAAVAAAASVHFADNPTYRGVNWNDVLLVGCRYGSFAAFRPGV